MEIREFADIVLTSPAIDEKLATPVLPLTDEAPGPALRMALPARPAGLEFGDIPVNGYFWGKGQEFESLLDYLAGLPLTFEGRNLDHTLEFEVWFHRAGDEKSAGVMRAIHRDEIQHVAFGWHWLRQLKS